MQNLKKALEEKKFEAVCRELNDLVNSLHPPKEISVSYELDYHANYKKIDIHFYKWAPDDLSVCGYVVDNIWFYVSTNISGFNYKIKAIRDALIAFKKGEFVWSEQAAIAKQIR